MRKTGGKCISGGNGNSTARWGGLCSVILRTLDGRQGLGKGGIGGRKFLRDFTSHGIRAPRPGPIPLFRKEIAES